MNIIAVCRKKIAHVAEEMGGKSHLVYLAAATLLDSSIIIRVCTGSCLVFCLMVEVFRDKEGH